MADALANPILNRPYDMPLQHFEIGPNGPTGRVIDGRRPSESFVPVPASAKGAVVGDSVEVALDLDIDGERRQVHDLVNELRREVDLWRARRFHHATAISRKLLEFWQDENRENRVLFCQREAAETAIFLTEAAGRDGYSDWNRRLAAINAEYNDGLPRIALKMATGAGKTVVMAMLIAWQTLNKATNPHSKTYTNKFLVVTPGITIRDRLRVLEPGHPGNYYDERELVPPDLYGLLGQAQLVITNYHSFQIKEAKELRNVSKVTKQVLFGSSSNHALIETPDAMVSRVLRDFSIGTKLNEIVVLNDEAHHCYVDKPQLLNGVTLTKDEKDENENARVWFRGLQAVAKRVGIKRIFDLSATPFYLAGSGYNEGLIFPWVVSDFSLMDAIESGIVTVPRIPIDDDATTDAVVYRDLWQHVGEALPKKKTAAVADSSTWPMPTELEGALHSLYRSYEKSFANWQEHLAPHGEPPPVMIVVCPNTIVSKLVYDWIAGHEATLGDTTVHRAGKLEHFSNVVDGRPLSVPRTILIDSLQLEASDALSTDFRDAAGELIEAYKAHLRVTEPGLAHEEITDAALLREVMNTVGKRGKLGEGIRCVVSVAMLTEGWDANTVTHILGVRAFGSQLLCEQVIGRGLRRRSYELTEDGYFTPEYANVYGIPFAFIPSDRAVPQTPDKRPVIEVASIAARSTLRIEFPHVDGYRVEIPDEQLIFDAELIKPFPVAKSTVPNWTEISGIVGEADREDGGEDDRREQRLAYELAELVLNRHFSNDGLDPKPWLFPKLLRITREWTAAAIVYHDGFDAGHLLGSTERLHEGAEAISTAIARHLGNRREHLRPLLRRYDPVGSTEDVRFLTRKKVRETAKSEVSHVTLDGADGNTWEQLLAAELELNDEVAAYVKNDHLGFTIPYVHKGRTHHYLPDFLVRLKQRPGDIERTLIIEVSGGQKSPGPTTAKSEAAKAQWVPAVNNHRAFGRWGYVEFTTMTGVDQALRESIGNLYADRAIIGDPDLLDHAVFDTRSLASTPALEVRRGA